MYKYHEPKPIVIDLNDEWGYKLRQQAADFVKGNFQSSGGESGDPEEQAFGKLAELVIRDLLKLPSSPEDKDTGHDIKLPSGVRVDVKCRSGERGFQELYESSDGVFREAKHNLYARQVNNTELDADIYLLTHLQTPGKVKIPGKKRKEKARLPGSMRQSSWRLYICGWASKDRVSKEQVFLPRGSLTERANSWFTYLASNVEFYNQNLMGFSKLEDLLKIDFQDVAKDKQYKGKLNMTSSDAERILFDLVGRGILTKEQLLEARKELELKEGTRPFLHPNQYHHLVEYLEEKGIVGKETAETIEKTFPKEKYVAPRSSGHEL